MQNKRNEQNGWRGVLHIKTMIWFEILEQSPYSPDLVKGTHSGNPFSG